MATLEELEQRVTDLEQYVAWLAGLIYYVREDQKRLEQRVAALENANGGGEGLWPGHQPGEIYIGANNESDNFTAPLGAIREFFQEDDTAKEIRAARDAHRKNELPWISFKGPNWRDPDSWQQVAAGQHDDVLRAKAREYVALEKPTLLTFHHEPIGNGRPEDWRAAFLHVIDIFEDETGFTNPINQVTICPILNAYVFERWHSGSADDWYTQEILDRCPLIGWDNYGHIDRWRDVTNWCQSHGVQSIGVAEFGRGTLGNNRHAFGTEEFLQILAHAASHPIYSVMTYFNDGSNKFGVRGSYDDTGIPHPLEEWNNFLSGSCYLSDL